MTDIAKLTALCEQNGAQIETQVALSALTTFRIGGPCDALVTLPDEAAAQNIVAYLRENSIPYALIGRGSNLLAADSGFRGVILKLGGKLAEGIRCADGILTCGAGESLKNLCLTAAEHCLTGLEFAYGIPGSVGGAVFMNAGAYDGEFSQILLSVTVLDEAGEIRSVPAEALDLSYRHSILMERDWIVLTVSVMLEPGMQDEIRAKMQDLIGRRKSKQPLEYPSAGSTFKRPAGSYASKLIDECGLKGYTVGGAQVSEKHAGFVINRGNATFADVMAVCRHVQDTVRKQTGFVLELEPEIIGNES
ncbi:MAG: UDP-N-acetylmuramate dehydrogenase [Oscillospiraceae bacterium]|nr:UDP-N-acetylmuramate dehydrogenase [Oscillospiraceae bacterium]